MKNRIITILIFALMGLAIGSYIFVQSGNEVPEARKVFLQAVFVKTLPFERGEKISYEIKNLGIKMGEATLVYRGRKTLDNHDVYLIQFTAKGFNFLDEEKIYADTESFFPVQVERDLNIWGKKERIIERYDQKKGLVTITKVIGKKVEEQKIERQGLIDNIYCFIYRMRRGGKLKIGDSFSLTLPTQKIQVTVAKRTSLKTTGRRYDAYYVKSNPSKYKVWFDTSDKQIPLKISGAIGISNTAMTIVSYGKEPQGG